MKKKTEKEKIIKEITWPSKKEVMKDGISTLLVSILIGTLLQIYSTFSDQVVSVLIKLFA